METTPKASIIRSLFLRPITPPEKDWVCDLCIIAAAWFAVRIPLMAFRVPPLVQCDSYWYMNFFNTIRLPHYPFIYGEFLEKFGHFPAMLVQHFLVLLCSVMLYIIGKSLSGRAGGLCSGLLAAIYGSFVLYAHSIMSETLFNFFLVCHLGVLWIALIKEKAQDKWYGAWFFLAGFLASVASNVRPVIQYQVVIVFLVLFPFYMVGNRILRLLKLIVFMAAGFLSLHLYVAGATYTHYGLFGISSGLPKAAMYRMVFVPDAPVSGVPASDPQLAAVRDYLAGIRPEDNLIWLGAYNHIRNEILPRFQPGRTVTAPETDRVIMQLWKRYVFTYPGSYWRQSLKALGGVIEKSETFSRLWAVSLEVSRDELRPLPQDVVSFMEGFYLRLSSPASSYNFLCIGALAGFFFMFAAKPPGRHFMAVGLATMLFLLAAPIIASVGILRYRYPFDMAFCLVAGAGFCFLTGKASREKAGRIVSLAGRFCVLKVRRWKMEARKVCI